MEVKPLFTAKPLYILSACFQPLLAIYLLSRAWLSPNHSFFTKRDAAGILYFTIILFALYLSQQRWGYYAFPILALTIAPHLGALFEPTHPAFNQRWPTTWISRFNDIHQLKRRLPIALLIVGLPILLIFLSNAVTDRLKSQAEKDLQARKLYCYNQVHVAARSGALNHLEGDRPLSIALSTDLGLEILYFTPHKIVASNYHREGDAIEYLFALDTIKDARQLRIMLAKRNIDILIVCPEIDRAPNSILQSIANGAYPPKWLKPIDITLPPSPPTDEDEPIPAHAAPQFLMITKTL